MLYPSGRFGISCYQERVSCLFDLLILPRFHLSVKHLCFLREELFSFLKRTLEFGQLNEFILQATYSKRQISLGYLPFIGMKLISLSVYHARAKPKQKLLRGHRVWSIRKQQLHQLMEEFFSFLLLV